MTSSVFRSRFTHKHSFVVFYSLIDWLIGWSVDCYRKLHIVITNLSAPGAITGPPTLPAISTVNDNNQWNCCQAQEQAKTCWADKSHWIWSFINMQLPIISNLITKSFLHLLVVHSFNPLRNYGVKWSKTLLMLIMGIAIRLELWLIFKAHFTQPNIQLERSLSRRNVMMIWLMMIAIMRYRCWSRWCYQSSLSRYD